MKHKRVSTRVHTRKIDRNVVRVNLKKAGYSQICKHGSRGTSYFSNNWERFV